MKFAWTWNIKEEFDEYVEIHLVDTRPEILKAYADAGINNLFNFLKWKSVFLLL